MSDSGVETVVLVGTGALQNGWSPVCGALDALYPHLGIGADSDAANFWFSRTVQAWRFTAAHSAMSTKELILRGLEPREVKAFKKDSARLVLENRKAERILKATLSEYIKRATAAGKMTLSKDFAPNVFATGSWSGPTAIVTTNWDLLLDDALKKVGRDGSRVWHLHGHVDDPDHMLLPSELPEEPYRTKSAQRHIASAQRRWRVFNAAKRIIIYGLSLSPLDASLAQAIAVGLDNPAGGRVGDIYVLNWGPHEVARVAKRVSMLCEKKWPWRIHQLDCSATK